MKPQQIEQTAKRYKGTIAIGVLMIIIGMVWWIFGAAAGNTGHSGTLMLAGIILYFGGRISAWWNHG